MNMPSFTAEAALFRNHGYYHTSKTFGDCRLSIQLAQPGPLLSLRLPGGSPTFPDAPPCPPGQLCGDPLIGLGCCWPPPRTDCRFCPDDPLFQWRCCLPNDPHCCSEGPGPCPGGALLCRNHCCPTGQYCGNTFTGRCCPDDTVYTYDDNCCPPALVCSNPTTGRLSCGCGLGQICVNGQCQCPPEGPRTSSQNVLLYDSQCNGIRNLQVRFQVTQDMVATVTPPGGGTSTPDGGFTMQLNAFNPAGASTSWMQYFFLVQGNAINGQVQYWNIAAFNNCVNTCNANCLSSTNVSQCLANCPGNCVNSQTRTVNLSSPKPILSLSSNTIPAGYVFEIDLSDNNGNITGATFNVTDNNGHTQSWPAQLDANHQFPIVAFQVNIVGPDNSTDATFTSGAGNITYGSSGQICVEGGVPDKCSGSGTTTAETSNVSYALIGPPCCGSSLTQSITT